MGKALRQLAAKGHTEPMAIALYLLTGPHAHYTGLYYLPIGYLCMDTGLSVEGASEGLASLSQIGFCTYDEETDYILVHEQVTWQLGPLKPSDNRVAGLHKELDLIPDSPLKTKWLLLHGVQYHFQTASSTLNDCGLAVASPSEAPSKPPIIEVEVEIEVEDNLCPPAVGVVWRKPSFSDFWRDLCKAYPDRGPGIQKGTPRARDKVQKLYAKVKTYEDYEDIFAAVRALGHWADWRVQTDKQFNRSYVPQMATWVNEIPKRDGWWDMERVIPEQETQQSTAIEPVQDQDFFVNDQGEKIDLLTNRPFDPEEFARRMRGAA